MKHWISLTAALALLLVLTPLALHAGEYPSQFRGVCQQCGRDLIAYYQPVRCTNGTTDYQWVTAEHRHCRPACKGKVKYDFFNSYLMNPANPKWKDAREGKQAADWLD
jgi:hypothetical protein